MSELSRKQAKEGGRAGLFGGLGRGSPVGRGGGGFVRIGMSEDSGSYCAVVGGSSGLRCLAGELRAGGDSGGYSGDLEWRVAQGGGAEASPMSPRARSWRWWESQPLGLF